MAMAPTVQLGSGTSSAIKAKAVVGTRVSWLIAASGLEGVPQPRRWRKKWPSFRPDGVENHLARDFQADLPNTKWMTDLTYIRAGEYYV
jgi:transposase InsO family protein